MWNWVSVCQCVCQWWPIDGAVRGVLLRAQSGWLWRCRLTRRWSEWVGDDVYSALVVMYWVVSGKRVCCVTSRYICVFVSLRRPLCRPINLCLFFGFVLQKLWLTIMDGIDDESGQDVSNDNGTEGQTRITRQCDQCTTFDTRVMHNLFNYSID